MAVYDGCFLVTKPDTPDLTEAMRASADGLPDGIGGLRLPVEHLR